MGFRELLGDWMRREWSDKEFREPEDYEVYGGIAEVKCALRGFSLEERFNDGVLLKVETVEDGGECCFGMSLSHRDLLIDRLFFYYSTLFTKISARCLDLGFPERSALDMQEQEHFFGDMFYITEDRYLGRKIARAEKIVPTGDEEKDQAAAVDLVRSAIVTYAGLIPGKYSDFVSATVSKRMEVHLAGQGMELDIPYISLRDQLRSYEKQRFYELMKRHAGLDIRRKSSVPPSPK